MAFPTPSAHRLVLEGELTVRDAEALHARLLAAINAHAEVVADCSAATLIDVCALQLLLSARRTAQRCGKRFALAGPPEGVLREALVRGGLLTEDAGSGGRDAAFWREGSVAA